MRWNEYWQLILLLSVLYYITVLLLYFSKELKVLLSSKLIPSRKKNVAFDASETHPSNQLKDEDLVTVTTAATAEVSAYLEQCSLQKEPKEKVLSSLKKILYKFPIPRGSDQELAINQYIQLECYSICSIHLSSEDLQGLWLS